MLKFRLSLLASDFVKKPSWFNAATMKRDPAAFSENLNRRESIELATWLDYKYHEKNVSVVSDEAYDILIGNIKSRWPSATYLKKIGHKVVTKGRKEVALPVFMPSLDKITATTAGLDRFVRGSLVVMDKLDGISLLVEYKNGKPFACYTRGNGQRGQDVSGVLPSLNIPKSIPEKDSVLVRCEFIISKSGFAKHAKTEEREYKTARNMGGGLLTRNTPSAQVAAFDVIAYEVCGGKLAGKPISQQLSTLTRWGFSVVRHRKSSAITAKKLPDVLNKFREKARYEIDGIVVVQDKPYRITRSNPTHAKAFKLNSLESSRVVTVKSVEWNLSRYGKIIPRVIVDPILLGGVTVENFTGHNYFYINNGFRYQDRSKGLPVRPINKGAQIRVIRSGDVIPYIMEVVHPARKPAEPDIDFVLDKNGVHAVEAVRRKSSNPELKKQRITHFFTAMGMKGVKAATIEKLFDAGFTSLKDILYASADDLMKADGIQKRSAENLVSIIDEGLANARFAKTAYASSLFGDKIGTRKLQAIIDYYPDILVRAKKLSPGLLQRALEEVPGIGTQAKIIAQQLPKFLKFLRIYRIRLMNEESLKVGAKLDGMNVLFTSVRDEQLLQDIISNGGKRAASVKSATHIVAKPGASNKKIDEAREKGIPIYDVDTFRRKFGL